jgi:membrane protein
MHRHAIWPLFRATALKWNADNCLRLGASLSYYTIFSLFPLILVVLTIIRLLFINSDPARDAILTALTSVTGGFRQEFIAALDAARQSSRGTGIVGTAALILGASWVFGELVSAFNIIWDLEAPAQGGPLHFIRSTFFSFALVLAGVFLLLVSMIVTALLAALQPILNTLPGGALLWLIVHRIINLLVLILIFALLFKALPQTYVAWRDVWLGAILTAIVWSLLQYAIARYIAFGRYDRYGAIGSMIALVVWVYLSSQVLFLGGEFTHVYAQRYGSRATTLPTSPLVSLPPQPLATSRRAADHPARATTRSHAASATIGALGALGVVVLALLLSIVRSIRRIVHS